jgi:hypothetical protein
LKSLLLISLLLSTNFIFGQRNSGYEIEGKIVSKLTGEPIPYANIYNKTLQKGTISNSDGYFRIGINNSSDSVFVTSVGYKKQLIRLSDNYTFYPIFLEESIRELKEVTVKPGDNSYLFDLLNNCRKKASDSKANAKAYYELKSFKDEKQVELVEGFYNVGISGYDVSKIDLKAGRLALQPYNDRFFGSHESSRALTMMKLFDKSSYFPNSPLDLSKKEAKKSFYLILDSKYLNNEKDSVYIIDYVPKDSSGNFFEGKIWVNKTRNTVLKITLNCSHCQVHPFLPLFPFDSIANVNFTITKTFSEQEKQMLFNHIDFTYVIDYKSRMGKENELNYSIKTNAVLYVYDFKHTFTLPTFEFADNATGDYRKINALPYNDFFWNNNDEYRLNDDKNSNELFFKDTSSLTTKTIFSSDSPFKKGLFEHPYIHWSKNRILFREALIDTLLTSPKGSPKTEMYNFDVKIFMDVNTYNDSTNILTATIFDPFESYYHLPIDNVTQCFINLFFDLCEIERRKLEMQLRRINAVSPTVILAIYRDFLKNAESQKSTFLKEIDRGTNQKGLLKWNAYVYKELGIDNLKIFGLK